MPDVVSFEVPMELRLELGAIVGLNDVDAKREAPPHLVHEADRGALVARVEHFEYANPRAVVDRGELVEPAATARDPLEELHVELEPMARLGLFVPLPALAVWSMLLIGRESVHAVSRQDAMH